jgi:AcrR family transcriptional regulator
MRATVARGAPTRAYSRLKPGPGRSAEEVAADQRERIHRAMVELVDTRGFEGVRVSDLARRARVSTQTFYEQSHGKQECLLDAYDEIMHRAARRMKTSQEGEQDWRRRSHLALSALATAVVEKPEAARFVCLDASAAGLGVLGRMGEAESTFEAVVALCFAPDPNGPPLRPVVAKAIVAGFTQVIRARLIEGREEELPGLVDELLEWAFSLRAPDLEELATLGSRAGDPSAAASALVLAVPAAAEVDPVSRERASILAATIELAVADGYWCLSVPRIRGAAGLSRRRFEEHFGNVEECFVAALDLVALRLAAFVKEQSQGRERDWPGGFHRAVVSLCADASSDPGLARLALIEVFASGPEGFRNLSRLVSSMAEQLQLESPAGQEPSLPVAEAAMGAIWGIVGDCVAAGRPERLVRLAPILSFLALAPTIGAGAAVEAIRAEEAHPVRQTPGQNT